MGVAKCMNVATQFMLSQILTGGMEGASGFADVRLALYSGLNIATSQGPGNHSRALYVNFDLTRSQTPNPSPNGGTDYLYESDRLLFLDPGSPFADTGSNDIYIASGYGQIQQVKVQNRWASYIEITANGGQYYFVLTKRGTQRINNVLTACWTLKGLGWRIAFGGANEPNNLGASLNWPGWPMTARSYLDFWQTVMGYVADQAYVTWSWSPPLVFGELSEYNYFAADPTQSYSYLLDDGTNSYNQVPPCLNSMAITFPDVRYPNLVLYWANLYGLSVVPFVSIVFHFYYGDAPTEVACVSAAVTGQNGPGPWQPQYTFRGGYNGVYYWLNNYVNRYGLTEWNYAGTMGCTPCPCSSQNVTNFLQGVWGSNVFQGLAPTMSVAYLFLDWGSGSCLSIMQYQTGGLLTQGVAYANL